MSTITSTEIQVLKEHNREVWGRTAPAYERTFEQLTVEAAPALLDAAGVGRGSQLLDIGTGPGTLIGPAVARGATVAGIDLSERMVEEARRRHHAADVRVGDAHALPYDDGAFDAVTLAFCLHHIPEPGAVLAEVRRVVRPGGRVALSVWAPGPQLEAFGIAFEVLGRFATLDGSPQLQAPSLGEDLHSYEDLLSAAGFIHPSARIAEIAWPLTDGAPVFEGFDGYFDLSGESEETRTAIRAALDDAVAQRAGRDGVARIPNPAVIASGQRAQ